MSEEVVNTNESTPSTTIENGEKSEVNQETLSTPIQTIPVYIKTLAQDGSTIQIQVTPLDSVQDIKQFLIEAPDTCYFTSFDLFLNGKKLNELSQLSEIADLRENSTIEMRFTPYDERSARMHVRRVRDILATSSADISTSKSPSVFSYHAYPEEDPESEAKNEEKEKESETTENGEKPVEKPVEKTEAVSSQSQNAHQANGRPKKGKKSPNNQTPTETKTGSLPHLAPLLSDKNSIDFNASLTKYYPPSTPTPPTCVKSIVYSGWNPPTGTRRLMGDLFYLEVITFEGSSICITACEGGFFVNGTQVLPNPNLFVPTPALKSYQSTTLVELLMNVSPTFKKNFPSVVQVPIEKHPFEMLPPPTPVPVWIQLPQIRRYDQNRAEDSIASSLEVPDVRGPLRDWNEEFQSCKELPNETIQDRLIRDRALSRINADFVDAATKGAVAVVSRCVPPINPMDPPRTHMFIYNNIFFSFAVDSRDQYKDFGGDLIAYQSANLDLKGVRLYQLADIKGLHTLATAIIDFQGHRVIAQSIIPGILSNEKASTVLYGSRDNIPPPTPPPNLTYFAHLKDDQVNGEKEPKESEKENKALLVDPLSKTLVSDPEFHKLMLQAGNFIHIKEHIVANEPTENGAETEKSEESEKVQEENHNEVVLACGADSKGIMGTDGRRYVLDLTRSTPRDSNYLKPIHAMAVLRPELISSYVEYMEEKDKEAEDQGKSESSPNGEASEKPKDKKKDKTEVPSKYVFNPNVFSYPPVKFGGDPALVEQDEKKVRDLGDFLKNMVLPKLIQDLVSGNIQNLALDGASLTVYLHTHGVNVRYLGQYTTLLQHEIESQKDSPPILSAQTINNTPLPILEVFSSLCLLEMVTRAAKHIFNSYLRTTPSSLLAYATSHFLNCFISTCSHPLEQHSHFSGKSQSQSSKKKKKPNKTVETEEPEQDSNTPTIFLLTHNSLFEQIRALVTEKFDFTLPSNYTLPQSRVAVLRNFCLKTGVQVVARDYALNSNHNSTPFTYEDILDLIPLVKHINPKSQDGQDLLEAGKALLMDSRLEQACEVLSEALTLLIQVHGPIHVDVASCDQSLAMGLFSLGEFAQAIQYQKRSTLVYEKVLGTDHYDTAFGYSSLALYCHTAERHREALGYMGRAVYLFSVISSSVYHSEYAACATNIAMMLQGLQKIDLSVEYLKESLRISEMLYGKDHVNIAITCHAIALSLSMLQEYKVALQYQKRNYSILSTTLGEHDARTKESSFWLSQLTTKAVQKQMQLKRQQQDEFQNQLKLLNANKQPKSSSVSKLVAPQVNYGHLPISEVLRYINSGSKGTKVGGSGIKLMGKTTEKGKEKEEEEEEETTTYNNTTQSQKKKPNKKK
eukprot:TRINITY_DN7410_c0_g1_i1.p1 TRINITY_DN7410_c0_g1~~TRINITY_DN7410_c0_g1_i1.p1  ORF type:complete len:1364 (+),score=366.09 TRINITY_DN7410_c0_g1_i1:107-4198(+)